MTRLGLLLVVVLLFLLCMPGALAQNMIQDADFFRDAETINAKKMNLPAKTTFPVYGAPDKNAYRGANGKASVSLKEPFLLLATAREGSWWLIEYNVSGNARRTGWINVAKEPEVPVHHSIYEWEYEYDDDDWESGEEGEANSFVAPSLDLTDLGRIRYSTMLTDDPRGSKRELCTLPADRRLGVFFSENLGSSGTWVYVITETEGRKVCGFVKADAVELLEPVRIDGDTLIFENGIEFLGQFEDWLDSLGIMYKDGGPVLAAAEFGMVQFVPNYDELLFPEDTSEYLVTKINHVSLPSTLRLLGDDAFAYMSLSELVIPEGTRNICGMAALFSMNIGTLRLPSTLESFEYCTRFSTVECYEVEPSNPNLKSADGVVLSKDGKTLLCYPNGKKDEHYDVPRGTEGIHAYAFYAFPFYDGAEPIPLRSLSLPIGLRRIEPFALYGLQELVSLVIPPTVVEIGPYALGDMVSLSQFSIPEHLRKMVGERWITEHEQNRGDGDNGKLVGERNREW